MIGYIIQEGYKLCVIQSTVSDRVYHKVLNDSEN